MERRRKEGREEGKKEWMKERGISLVVQWLRLCFQCKGHGFDTWLEN